VKKLIAGILVGVFGGVVFIPTIIHATPIKTAIYALGQTAPASTVWMNKTFAILAGAPAPSPADYPNKIWSGYWDVYGTAGPKEYLALKDYAASKSVNAEEMLLHAKINYASKLSTAWSQMDKFDNFEGVKGVMLESSGIFTDKTTVAYSGASPYTTIDKNLYVGYEEPFDKMIIDVRTAASSLVGTWQYYNGYSWATLAVTDGTSAMTVHGTVSFTPPSSWSRTIVNGSRSKYFVKFAYTSAAISPVINTIKGDNWLRGANNLCRGWDATDPNIINTGELAYNPNPPAGASAKFRYQSRIPFWASNYFVANVADKQTIDGVYTKSFDSYNVKKVTDVINSANYNGIMLDDAGANPLGNGIDSTSTDFVDKTRNTWDEELVLRYRFIAEKIHALIPGVKVGLNSYSKNLVKEGDWNLSEYMNYVWTLDYPRNIVPTDSYLQQSCTYDDYLPGGVLENVKGMFIYADTVNNPQYYINYPTSTDKTAYAWERGNRSPIWTLTKHLIAQNDNTYFAYFTRGGFWYSDRDTVHLKDGSTVSLSTPSMVVPDVSTVDHWEAYFPAMGVDFGVPDTGGWNGGARSFTWKLGTEIGGTSTTNVWRRDYTNAVVLHRTASWNTNIAEYDTPSMPIPLGGTYYPLNANGLTGAGITSISLRAAEGAILMKSPNNIYNIPTPMSAPRNLKKN